jgi:L-threonylcarbamoyladenylate synthase
MLQEVDHIWVVARPLADYTPAAQPQSLPSPGVGIRHYAPHAKLILADEDRDNFVRTGKDLEDVLVDAIDQAFDGAETIGVMLPDHWNASCAQLIYQWGPWHQPEILAQRLFAGLRELDDRGATIIICPVPGVSGIGEAIRDRLQKAARS